MYSTISIDEFETIYQSKKAIHILDVRETDEFESGHIPGAISLPLSTFPAEPKKGQEYYVFCASGGRSAMACQYLAGLGHSVTNVLGGMSAWRGDLE